MTGTQWEKTNSTLRRSYNVNRERTGMYVLCDATKNGSKVRTVCATCAHNPHNAGRPGWLERESRNERGGLRPSRRAAKLVPANHVDAHLLTKTMHCCHLFSRPSVGHEELGLHLLSCPVAGCPENSGADQLGDKGGAHVVEAEILDRGYARRAYTLKVVHRIAIAERHSAVGIFGPLSAGAIANRQRVVSRAVLRTSERPWANVDRGSWEKRCV
jgi:hypothetical protein